MAEIASAFVSIAPSLQGFSTKLSAGVTSSTGSVGKSAGSAFGKVFAAAAALGIGAAVGGFLKDAIGQASDLNEVTTKTQAIFGRGSKAIEEFASKGAQALGQTKLEVLDASASFGTFGKAAGLSGVDLAKFSTGFVSLSTDLASFNNTTPQQAVEAIGAALRGESEPLRQYGVLLNDATLKSEALKLGLIKTTTDALTPQQKVLAAQAAIYKQTRDAQGDFQKTSGGLANQQRILSASFSDIKTQIGTGLLPVATQFFTFLNGEGLPALQSLRRGFTANVLPAIRQVASVIQETLEPPLRAVFTFLQDNPAVLKGIGIAFGIAAAAAGVFAIAMGAVAVATSPITLTVLAIAALGAGVALAYQRSETFRTAIQSLGEAFAQFAPQAQAIWTQIKTVVVDALGAVSAVIKTDVAVLTALWNKFGSDLVSFISGSLKNIATVISGAFTVISGLFRAVKALLTGDWQGLWDAVKQIVSGATQIVKGVIQQAWNFIKTATSIAWGAVRSLVSAAWDGIKSVVSAGVDRVVAFAQALPGRILKALGDLGSLLLQVGKDIVAGLVRGIISSAGSVVEAIKSSITDKIPDFVKDKLGIASPSKVMADIARWIPEGLAKGIADNAYKPAEAMQKVIDALKAKAEGIRSVLGELRSAFDSLSGSIASTFAGNPFEATTYEQFITGIGGKMTELTGLKEAFRKLRGWGISSQFISQLFASGNGALILDLAGGTKQEASFAASGYAITQNMAAGLGTQVAGNQFRPEIDRVVNKLERLERAIDRVGPAVGKAINGAVSDGRRGGGPTSNNGKKGK